MKELKNESKPSTGFIDTIIIVGLVAILFLLSFGAFNILLN
jgi:hypothetical protein